MCHRKAKAEAQRRQVLVVEQKVQGKLTGQGLQQTVLGMEVDRLAGWLSVPIFVTSVC